MDKGTKLSLLQKTVEGCTKCKTLSETRNKIVFGEGDPNARIAFLGEAPGQEEDETGRPFVGRSGKLLRQIIASMGWMESDVYICNTLKCRPPNNRNPSAEELCNCESYLKLQLAVINPKWIICLGKFAAFDLLK